MSIINEDKYFRCLTTPPSDVHFYLVGTSFAILTVATISLNALVLIALFKLKRYHSVYDILVIFLVITDLVSGIIIDSLSTLNTFLMTQWQISCFMYDLNLCFTFILLFSSILTISLMTKEMYMSITRPFDVPRSVKKYKMLILVMYSLVCIITVVPFYLWNAILEQFELSAICSVLLVFIGLCFTQCKLYNEVKRMQKRQNGNQINEDCIIVVKTMKMTMSILIAFASCFLPQVGLALFYLINGPSDTLSIYVGPWFDFIVLCNPLLDPLIYCFRMKSVRNTVYNIIFCKVERIAPI